MHSSSDYYDEQIECFRPYLIKFLLASNNAFDRVSVSCNFSLFAPRVRWLDWDINRLESLDSNRAALIALEHGRTVMVEASGRTGYSRHPEDIMPIKNTQNLLHKWQFLKVKGPKSSQVSG